VDLFRISGQRKVPVLKDGNQIIADSTEIAKYLDRQYPNRPLFQQIRSKGAMLLMEEWADESIGVKSKVLFEHSARIKTSQSLLPSATPDIVKSLIEVLPSVLYWRF